MQNLPPELLAQVFTTWNEALLDPNCDQPDALIKYNPRSSPNAIASLVCRKWDIVVSTPVLWTILPVRFGPFVEGCMQGIKLATERSKICSLRVVISGTGLEPGNEVTLVMNALNHTMPRWSELVVTTAGPWHADVLSYFQSPMPALTYLFIVANTVDRRTSSSHDLFPTNFIPSAPNLSTAYFENVPFWLVNVPSFPKLTTFEVEFDMGGPAFSGPKLLQLIQRSPNLQHLRALKGVCGIHLPYEIEVGHPINTISHPKLRSVHLDIPTFTADRPFFVDCPSLRNFNLSCSGPGPGYYLSTALESLSLTQCDLADARELVNELYSMPNLRRLYIGAAEFLDDDFCAYLMAPPQGKRGWVCPKLQNLRLEDIAYISGRPLVRLLRSRSYSDLEQDGLMETFVQSHVRPLPWLEFSVVKFRKVKRRYQTEIDNWRTSRGLKEWEPPEDLPTRGLHFNRWATIW